MKTIDRIEIRMYGLGTGDCFVIKYIMADEGIFTMMIDGGAWKLDKETLDDSMNNLKEYVGNRLNVLVVTHEHLDHLNVFDRAENVFNSTDFTIDEIWMAWTEDESDELAVEWKNQFGQKKKALALASENVRNILKDDKFQQGFSKNFNHHEMLEAFNGFSDSLTDFEDLHYHRINGMYKGDLKGMEAVKRLDTKLGIRYLEPGDIETNSLLPGIKFYVLGPPRSIKAVRKEKGSREGEAYEHNKVLRRSEAFSVSINMDDSERSVNAPFEPQYFEEEFIPEDYTKPGDEWRKIDHDWLMTGAGSLALRLNSGLNNLSLVFAIEIEDTGEVLLFTGDAEIGNWSSWHDIDWPIRGSSDKHLTTDLLNRTVFYKVAHHLSHNGTARDKGLKLMRSRKLVSMASLDYDSISSRWTSTMPNRGILKDLITQTRGRLIVMNEKKLFVDFEEDVPLIEKINNARSKLTLKEKEEFKNDFTEQVYSKQYTIRVNP